MKKQSVLAQAFGLMVCMAAGAVAQQQSLPPVPAEGPTKPALNVRPEVASDSSEYMLGPGDEVSVVFVGHPELSGTHIVGPDGRISMAVGGDVSVNNESRGDAAKTLEQALAQYYPQPLSAMVSVTRYASNKVMVLGNVEHPGYVFFDGTPTLLEAVTKAGLTNPETKQSMIPERCAIYRGSEKVYWIQLREALETGDRTADVRLTKSDIVFVPQQNDPVVSVMGAVEKPGAVKLRMGATLATVLADSGGISDKAGNSPTLHLVHTDGKEQLIQYKDLVAGRVNREIVLRPGDVLYVPKSGFFKATYVMERIAPLVTSASFLAVAGMR